MNRNCIYLFFLSLFILTMISCRKDEKKAIITHVFDAEDSLVVSRFGKLDSIVFICSDSAHLFKGPIRAKRIILQYIEPELYIQGDPDFTGASAYGASSAKIVYYDSVQNVTLWIEVSLFIERSGVRRLYSICKYYLKYGELGNNPYSAIPIYWYHYNYKIDPGLPQKATYGLPSGFNRGFAPVLNISNTYLGLRTFNNCYVDSVFLRFPEKNVAVMDSLAFPIFSYQLEPSFMHPDGRYEDLSNFVYERLK